MEPIYGFMLYFAACMIVSAIASKRGRSGLILFVVSIVAGVGMVMFVSQVIGQRTMAGFGAFLVPLAALVWALMTKSSAELAVEEGHYGDFRKCPFCAESVRKEAIKCKHCGSSIEDSM